MNLALRWKSSFLFDLGCHPKEDGSTLHDTGEYGKSRLKARIAYSTRMFVSHRFQIFSRSSDESEGASATRKVSLNHCATSQRGVRSELEGEAHTVYP